MFVRYARNLEHTGRLSWNPGGPSTYGLTSLAYFSLVLGLEVLLKSDPVATLLVASFTAMIVFCALAGLACHARADNEGFFARVIVVGSILLWGVDSLGWHATSGMDTAFAMAALLFVLLLYGRWVERPDRRSSVILGCASGGLMLVRPDTLLLVIPALM